MKTGLQVMQEKGMNIFLSSWSLLDFIKVGLNPIVKCKVCGLILYLPHALVDEEEGFVYRRDCVSNKDG